MHLSGLDNLYNPVSLSTDTHAKALGRRLAGGQRNINQCLAGLGETIVRSDLRSSRTLSAIFPAVAVHLHPAPRLSGPRGFGLQR